MTMRQPLCAPAVNPKAWMSRSRSMACAALLAAATMLPAWPAHGSDGPTSGTPVRQSAALPLPEIPYLQTTPWLGWAPYRNGLKIDTLQLPRSPFDDAVDHDMCPRPPAALPIS